MEFSLPHLAAPGTPLLADRRWLFGLVDANELPRESIPPAPLPMALPLFVRLSSHQAHLAPSPRLEFHWQEFIRIYLEQIESDLNT